MFRNGTAAHAAALAVIACLGLSCDKERVAPNTSHVENAVQDPAVAPASSSPSAATGAAGAVSPALVSRLILRAVATEGRPHKDEWDRAADLALAIRARVELLRARVVPAEQVSTIRDRALAAASLVLSYEVRGNIGQSYAGPDVGDARGWGTSKSIKLGTVAADKAVDAYTTSTTLGGLADLAEFEASQGNRSGAADLFAKIAPIADHWIEHRMFDIPGGSGRSWEKIVTVDPAIHHYVVYNTDAEFSRDLAILASVARTLGDGTRAATYENVAISVGKRLRDTLIAPILEGGPHPERWAYALELRDDQLTFQRVEDSNHASFTLDFIALAVERNLGGIFTRSQLNGLGTILDASLFVKSPEGGPAYSVFVNPAETSNFGVRNKKKIKNFTFAAEGDSTTEVASWWKELAGPSRDLDLGLSIRTSWGWSEAVSDRPAVLDQIGQYLEAEARCGQNEQAANVFLSFAVWTRVKQGA